MSKEICKRPHVGVSVILKKDGKILIGRRQGAHGEGTWSFPGGKLDSGEDILSCAKRELFEETDVKAKNMRFGPYTNDFFSEGLHYVTIFLIADYSSGTLKIKEPKKCLEWRWVNWSNLPKPLFLPIENLLKQRFNPLKIRKSNSV